MAFKIIEVEFIGGPFDGEIHPFCEPLIPLLGIPIPTTLEFPFSAVPATDSWSASSAFYESEQREGAFRYRFIRTAKTSTELGRSDPAIKQALEAGWRAMRKAKKPNDQ